MQILRPAVMAMLVAACPLTVLITPSFAQICECPPGDAAAAGAPASGPAYLVQSDEPPPPIPEYDQPPIPAPGYTWTPGYWAWNNDDYYWVPGVWVEPPQPGLLWTPGYWAFIGGVYAFRHGYWGHEVGYYGGIDYGYGYGGSGYQGGRWDNGQFFYNTTVNNIGGAHITNVYNQPIVRNPTINRASFNGGPGGVVAAPTAAQAVIDRAQHIPPTAAQRNQARLASVDRTQFVSLNKGKPAIAATERPGEFKGKGVIPARAAGKAALATPAQPLAPAPAGVAPPPGTPPAAEKPIQPAPAQVAPNAAKREEKPPVAAPAGGLPATAPAERPPGVAPAGKPPAAVERTPATLPAERPPVVAKPPVAAPAERPPTAAERTPAAARPPAAAERPPVVAPAERPPVAARPPVAERPPAAVERFPAAQRPPVERPPVAAPRPEPGAAAQRMMERPPAPALAPRPPQPERRAPPGECGRPGLPPCPK